MVSFKTGQHFIGRVKRDGYYPITAFVGMLVFLAHLFAGIFIRTRIPDLEDLEKS